MRSNWHSRMATVIVLLFGFILLYIGTDGFRAYTAEAARIMKLTQTKPQFPDVVLEDSFGQSYSISDLGEKYLFITFLYTSCMTVCPQLERNMATVYELLPDEWLGEDIIFLSISFDPDRDDPAVLNKYKDYFGSDGVTWRMARIPDKEQLQTLLDAFGVIVIPDNYGNFAHNSAFYFVDRSGRLIDVMDYTKTEEAAAKVSAQLEKEE